MTEPAKIVLALLFVAFAATSPASAGEIYRWVDARGNVTYSDQPPQPHEIAPLPAAPRSAPAPPAAAPPAALSGAPVRSAPVNAPRAAVSTTGASVPASGPRTSVDELLELSGLKAQLPMLLSSLAGEFRPRKGRMSPRDEAAIERVLAQVFRPQTVYASIRADVEKHVDGPKMASAAAWLRSPLGRKITAIEIGSASPANGPKVMELAQSLKTHPAPPARADLVQRLEWVSGTSELTLDIIATMTRNTQKAISAVAPPERRLRSGQIERQSAEARASSAAGVRQQTFVSLLYTYRAIDDRELEQYIAFEASDAGRWYSTITKHAFLRTLDDVLGPGMLELVKAVPPERWPRPSDASPPPPR